MSLINANQAVYDQIDISLRTSVPFGRAKIKANAKDKEGCSRSSFPEAEKWKKWIVTRRARDLWILPPWWERLRRWADG